MSNTWDDLRDLSDKINKLCREHPSWSIVRSEVEVLTDHISAKARIHEMDAKAIDGS
jgi:hypothetical protein